MSDDATRTRFLGAIAGQLPPDRVIEVHLFGPIRQGGMESGVAVIAVDPNEPVPRDAYADAPEADSLTADQPTADQLDEEQEAAVALAAAEAPQSLEALLHEPVVGAEGNAQVPDGQPDATGDAGDHAGYDAPVDLLPLEPEPVPHAPAPRYVVYTARYRHTLKGPDRGKWEASVTEEADAPLLTIDAVVRGVSRRSGEADETVRLSGDDFRAALPDPLPASAVRAVPVMRPRSVVRAPATGRRG